MQFNTANIIVRLPDGIKDQYDTSYHQGIFERDLRSDRLILRVDSQDYNAAKPTQIETKIGYAAPYDEVTRNLYQLEATDKDRRSPVKRYVLRDLLNAGGNLGLYNVTQPNTVNCAEPLVVIEDYHELNESIDYERGYALRVGTLQVESLKGAYLANDYVAVGNSYIISPAIALTSAAEMNATEWQNYQVIDTYNTSKPATIWQPNTSYTAGERLTVIAPTGVANVKSTNNGCRIIFTHKFNIDENNLVVYLPKY